MHLPARHRFASLALIAGLGIAAGSYAHPVIAQQLRIDSGFRGSDIAFGQAIQADGKPISAGLMTGPDGVAYLGVVRFTSDYKALDSTFANRGIALLTGYPLDPQSGVGVVVQSDGRIIAGATLQGGDFAAFALNTKGVLDSSYGSRGVRVIDFQRSYERVNRVISTPYGTIIGGMTDAGHPGRNVCALARIDMQGNVDVTFGNRGTLAVDFGGVFSSVYALCQTSDGTGNIMAAGGIAINGDTNMLGFRISRQGVVDTRYGRNGMFSFDFAGEGGEDIATAVVMLPQNSIGYVGYCTTHATAQDFAFAVSNTQGGLSLAVKQDFGGALDIPFSAALDPQGRIVVGGYAVNTKAGTADLAFSRFYTTGVDRSFGADNTGRITSNANSDGRIARALSVGSDGRIIVSGQAFNGSTGFDFLQLVLPPNGSAIP